MASVSVDSEGRRRILFMGNDGRRKQIRLGTMNAKGAKHVCEKVETILAAQFATHSLDSETAEWLGKIPNVLHARFVAVDLAEPRVPPEAVTLGGLIERFEAAAAVKPATKAAYRQTFESLRGHFKTNPPIRDLTPADADAWRKAIADSGLAAATVAKRVFVARAIFRKAIRWGLTTSNPFADLRAGSQANPERSFYVTREAVAAVLAACPDDEWRAIVALSRYAGLRCPSEVVGLRWGHVNWERGRLTVPSPKTSGHDGHAARVVPIAPELRPLLQTLFDRAPIGDHPILPRLKDPKINLRTMFDKIVTRAGLTPWPRLFHNMRASCATDWVEKYPAHVVAGWLGHSPLIAATHYLQVRDQHFDSAAGVGEGGAKSGALPAQKAAQQGSAPNRGKPRESSEALVGAGVTRSDADRRKTPRGEAMGEEGFEPPKA